MTPPRLVPLLVVRDVAAAIDFYCRALEATKAAVYMNTVAGTVTSVRPTSRSTT